MSKKKVPRGMSLTTKVVIVALSLAVAVSVAVLGFTFFGARSTPKATQSSDSHRYPANAEAGFLNQCEKTGSATLCGCVLHQLEVRFTFAQFRDFADKFTQTQSLPSGAVEALSTCTRSAAPSPSGT